MKKKIKTIFILSLSLLLISCGFKKLNQKNGKIIYIQSINVVGEQRVGYSLKNDILLISNNDSKNKYDVEIKITSRKTNKIKDSTGKVTRYNLSITASLQLISFDKKNKILRTFERNGDYAIAGTHSGTINNEQFTKKDVTQQLSQDIINFITLSMRTE
jgi:outer membrane lipopolysaccharide assembly protein LptE/RlpB|tara:strand:+ start:183 stop:659 length:477 start_codon:yes stop_codon:yes gene_type:complete